jgi:mono/diheme cytochrome c family protein
MSAISETAAKPETITHTTEAVPRDDSAVGEPTSTAATAAPPHVDAPKRPVPEKSAPSVGQSSAAEPSKAPTPQTAPTSDTTSAAPTPPAVEPPAPSRTDTRSVAAVGDATEGRAIVKARCAPCHGADGSGKTSMGTKYGLSDWRSEEVQAHSDAELDRILHEGAGRVSATAHKSKALSADEIGNVVAFIRSLK